MFLLVLLGFWLAAVITVPSVLLSREGQPASALGWIFALFALPPLGLLGWWLFGRTRLEKRTKLRRTASSSMDTALREAAERLFVGGRKSIGGLDMETLNPRLAEQLFPVRSRHRLRLLESPKDAYEAWEQAIEAAEHHVHAEFYTWAEDDYGERFCKLLLDARNRGVEVRVIIDGAGSAFTTREFFGELLRAGGAVEVFLKPRLRWGGSYLNFRNHRKLLVIDGERAWCGGINIGAEFADWQDLALEVHGEGALQLQRVFAEDWYFCSGEELTAEAYFPAQDGTSESDEDRPLTVVASGPDQPVNVLRQLVLLAIGSSRSRILLMTPYLVPDHGLLAALTTAANRGVDIRILMPASGDIAIVQRASRAFYPELLKAGIRVFEHPVMLHGKAMVFDDELSIIGSANFDSRSMSDNFELSALLAVPGLTEQLTAYMEKRLRQASEITLDSETRLSRRDRILNAAAHLLSPLL